jgi:outer membrane lipoprotein SlyB
MKRLLKFGYLFPALLVLSGCGSSLSPDVYTTQSAGQVNQVLRGRVLSARVVQVRNDPTANPGGLITGGALGGIAGSAIGHGRGRVLGTVGGAVAGGFLGNMAQQRLTSQEAIEYVIRLRGSRKRVSLVQGAPPVFQAGDRVLIQQGARTRIVLEP